MSDHIIDHGRIPRSLLKTIGRLGVHLVAGLSVAFVLLVLVPHILNFYMSLGTKMPQLTHQLRSMSTTAGNYWYWILPVAFVADFALLYSFAAMDGTQRLVRGYFVGILLLAILFLSWIMLAISMGVPQGVRGLS